MPRLSETTSTHRTDVHFTMGFELENFCRELGDEYVMLFRTHYFVTEQVDLKPWKGIVIDAARWDNINELYLVSDLLITDYSSVFLTMPT